MSKTLEPTFFTKAVTRVDDYNGIGYSGIRVLFCESDSPFNYQGVFGRKVYGRWEILMSHLDYLSGKESVKPIPSTFTNLNQAIDYLALHYPYMLE